MVESFAPHIDNLRDRANSLLTGREYAMGAAKISAGVADVEERWKALLDTTREAKSHLLGLRGQLEDCDGQYRNLDIQLKQTSRLLEVQRLPVGTHSQNLPQVQQVYLFY